MQLELTSEENGSERVRLLELAQSGSSEALGRLLEKCRQYLLLVANRELDADIKAKVGPSDLVQESLMEAHQAFDRFHGVTEANVLAWLRRILLNNIANVREHYRSTGKREIGREVPLFDILDSPIGEKLVDREPSPSNNAVVRERNTELELALTELPESYQEVLRLRHQESCTFEEIGQRMGRSPEAARKLWARGVEHLKQILKLAHDKS